MTISNSLKILDISRTKNIKIDFLHLQNLVQLKMNKTLLNYLFINEKNTKIEAKDAEVNYYAGKNPDILQKRTDIPSKACTYLMTMQLFAEERLKKLK